jgi:uncharacterized protein YhaN
MRLQRLELVRYGGWEGRVLDLGDGQPDLHLIVGPNEAGKSTLLSAIGDLLFGFPPRSSQDWRFDARDLRLAATVRDESGALSFVRRKGNKNTLLTPDGAVLDDAVLDPFLGGLDRPGFERLFGLDHARLRVGGQAILAGKDDAAQSLFEAGTGVTAVAARMRRFEEDCAELFKPSASNPLINRLLRERQETQDRLRKATIGEAEWTKLHQRRGAAEEKREALIGEDEALAARATQIERLSRARAPLRRLSEARDEIARLGPVPALPIDAADLLPRARTERATCRELEASHRAKRQRASGEAEAIVVSVDVLAAAPRIEALEETRSEIDRMRKDLPRKAADLDRVDAALAQARRTCGLATADDWPSPTWRRRARAHLEAARSLTTRKQAWAEANRRSERESERAAEALSAMPQPASALELQEALGALQPEAFERVEATEAASRRAERRAAEALAALGFTGSGEALAMLRLPSSAEVTEHETAIREAAEALKDAKQAATTAQADALRQRVRMDALSAGGELPTTDVVSASRKARDQAFEDVRARLQGERRPDDVPAAERLAAAIAQADRLADAREAASSQVTEYGLAASELRLAEGAAQSARTAIERAQEDGRLAEARWSDAVLAAGLPQDLRPAGFPTWKEARDRWLALRDDAEAAADAGRRDRQSLEAADARLSRALAQCGALPTDDTATRLIEARAWATRLETATGARAALTARIEDFERAASQLSDEAAAIQGATAALDEERERLLAEGHIAAGDGPPLADVLDALEGMSSDMGARPGLAHDVEGMRRDIAAFEDAARGLLADLARDGEGATSDTVRRLAADLRQARGLAEQRRLLLQTVAEETEALEAVTRRLAAAQSVIDGLIAAVAVEAEDDLDAVLALIARRIAALDIEAQAVLELEDIRGSVRVEDLSIAAAELDEPQLAAERDSIEARRREIATERELIGGELREVILAIDNAGTDTVAADAHQSAAEIRASLSAHAERYVEAAASAALLRWLIERHRAATQAPLLERAGALFLNVTGGAFSGLALDYGDDDRPRITCMRADGARLGVEALSEGTRDQLFLALRLGSLQTRARGGTPPLICDDLLVTSDDDRAGAILRVLHDASESVQVLVFSHHDHIVDVASRALGPGGFQLHRVTPQPGAAAA